MKSSLYFLAAAVLLAACLPVTVPPPTPAATPPEPSATPTPSPETLWISPAVPEGLRSAARNWNLTLTGEGARADLLLDIHPETANTASWIYVLAAPFPTIMEGVTSGELRAAWAGLNSDPFAGQPIRVSPSTLAAFTGLWGAPADRSVQVVDEKDTLPEGWTVVPSWAIVPFDSLNPYWKVLAVDGSSPTRRDFDASRYPLQIHFALQASQPDTPPSAGLVLPSSNRDPEKLTVLIMTGVTALVRGTAYTMELKGIPYPGSTIRDVVRQADILHISNEVSFEPGCPSPNTSKTRFYCSDPKYIGLLEDLGVDVVELTGNHNLDYSAAAALYSLDLYKQHQMKYFGGGANLQEAGRPLLVEDHGNRLAFIGCNAAGPDAAWATGSTPGANICSYPQFTDQITALRVQGYLPIVTFQYKEAYSDQPMPWVVTDFRKAANAGAAVVSGSQAHSPQTMEFLNGAFIHYGLGNFIFDQMTYILPDGSVTDKTRNEFIDRYIVYDGRLISIDLITARLLDYSRPRLMTSEERAAFLAVYFSASGWIPAPAATAYPSPTPTLTPLPAPQAQATAAP